MPVTSFAPALGEWFKDLKIRDVIYIWNCKPCFHCFALPFKNVVFPSWFAGRTITPPFPGFSLRLNQRKRPQSRLTQQMSGCFGCFCFSKREIKCLERRKKQIQEKIQSLQRDVTFAEEDQEKHERLIAKHQALRNYLRGELKELGQKVEEHQHSHDNLHAQVQQMKLQLEEICAAKERLKEQVTSEAQELQVVEAGCSH